MTRARLALLAALLLVPAPLHAWGWLQTPLAEAPPLAPERTAPLHGQPAGHCIAAILQAEARYGIPDNLLLALGIQEAGWNSPQGLTIWPWSVNAAGDGRRFNTRAEAEAFVARKQAEGVRSIDVGCLQINLRWHPDAFATMRQGFDVAVNVDYAARFLRGLYDESGDWQLAAGRYHSRSPGPQAVYLAGLARNQRVVRAQIARLTALAEGAPPHAAALAEAGSPPAYRSTGAIWGAEISGAEGAQRTLYSAQDLQPVLPNFLPPEA